MVMADILKRWQVLLGDKDAQLLTGTDEHGMKVGYIWNTFTSPLANQLLTLSTDSTSRSPSRHGYPSIL